MDARVNPAGLRDNGSAAPRERQNEAFSSPSAARSATRDASDTDATRLLVPIDASERSQWALRYALAQHRPEVQTELHLLFVAEPITRWEVLRFRTQAEIAEFQAQRAEWLLDDAVERLRQAGIKAVGHYRRGDPAFEIVDAAEQLGCDSIVLPRPLARWQSLFARDITREVLARAARVRVVTIGADGKASS